MKEEMIHRQDEQEQTCQTIRTSIISARKKVYNAVNSAMVTAYWEIGTQIYERLFRASEKYASVLSDLPKTERTAYRIELDALSLSHEGAGRDRQSLLSVDSINKNCDRFPAHSRISTAVSSFILVMPPYGCKSESPASRSPLVS